MEYNTIIIGSGISGLFVLKELKEKGIRDVIVLDKNPEPFGVWNIKNHPSVLNDTYTVSSKLYMMISDFPIDEDTAEFLHHSKILEYYKKYAVHHNLGQHIRNNTEVTNVKKEGRHWLVVSNNENYKCKNLVVATGTTNTCLNIPNDKMYKEFTGEIYHCDSIKNIQDKMTNKKILIIGMSDTASDVAELLKIKNSVTISSRNGIWFQNRTWGAYEPADMFYSRLVDFSIKNVIGKHIVHNNFGDSINNVERWWGKYGHGIKDWTPSSEYLNSYYVKSRNVIDSISKGQINPKNGVKNIEKKRVYFMDNTHDTFDVILFCTGYKGADCVAFLDKDIRYDKYKHIFSPHQENLYFIGFIRPYLTSIPMLSELQSRLIVQEIMNNNRGLPNKTEMLSEIKKDREKQKKEFPSSYERLSTIVDPYDYCNMIANKINAHPNLLNMIISDPNLAYICITGSWNHHYFRLNDSDVKKQNYAKTMTFIKMKLTQRYKKYKKTFLKILLHKYFYFLP
jgi:dimethylaniline monooxygenase (N-oxide forming)